VEVEPQVERVQQLQEMAAAALSHLALELILVQESKLALVGHHLNMVAVEMVTTPLVPQEPQDLARVLLQQRL
jgi:hypothetical protein